MAKYLRFMSVYLLALTTVAGILLGGAWMWLGFVVIYAIMIFGDELLGDYFAEPGYRHPRLLNSLLYLTLPTLFVLCVAMAWMAGSGDLFGLGAWVQANLGIDLFARREATSAWHWLGAHPVDRHHVRGPRHQRRARAHPPDHRPRRDGRRALAAGHHVRRRVLHRARLRPSPPPGHGRGSGVCAARRAFLLVPAGAR